MTPPSGFIKERFFHADGFIIRVKKTIRTNGFSFVRGFGGAAAGQPHFSLCQADLPPNGGLLNQTSSTRLVMIEPVTQYRSLVARV